MAVQGAKLLALAAWVACAAAAGCTPEESCNASHSRDHALLQLQAKSKSKSQNTPRAKDHALLQLEAKSKSKSQKAPRSRDHALLQLQAKSKSKSRETATAVQACAVGDWAPCPGGGSCVGNQCCPSGEVCPSADLHWNDCDKPKSVDCLPSYQQPCRVGALVGCPGSEHSCSGNQCCPGVNGTGSTVCPSAEEGWDDCDLPKAFDCVQPKCEVGAKVLCTPSSNPHAFCAGNECCGSPTGSFVCPSADRDWDQCDRPKAFDCLEPAPELCEVGALVFCPGTRKHCYGNQCCPGMDGSGSSVCPSAEPGWDGCDRPKQLDCLPQ